MTSRVSSEMGSGCTSASPNKEIQQQGRRQQRFIRRSTDAGRPSAATAGSATPKALAETKHFRIYLDNARYYHAKVLKEWIAATRQGRGVVFDLKHLPAYSPNLNLIERLWKFLRKEALQRWHATFEEMQQALAAVLDHLERYEEQLASLMTERFHVSPRVEVVVVGVGRAA